MVEIGLDELAATIDRELTVYAKDVQDGINKEAQKVARKAAKELRGSSPSKSGKYAQGWRSKQDSVSFGEISFVVYNSTRPGLAHLLEFGHAKRGGGRTRAFPHIKPAEQQALHDFEQAVERVINRG